ncbi:inactive tyrosine-protein kinase PRAG1-like isoform X2 [Agrilus planipennis]|uniref:Inactive tyrosine-protein kinase PRAG1-like isoform X2 n=1 Tax=Agrilus planipennis TaxID=224129 RepID=A0A1W4XQ95_AGRPL|nr:inactive tyrosine-protein kinase PRAG1-like isoform X2 [Agrilus planipennis]
MDNRSHVVNEGWTCEPNNEEQAPSFGNYVQWRTRRPSDNYQEGPPGYETDEVQHLKTTKTVTHSPRRKPTRTVTIRETKIETIPGKLIRKFLPEVLQPPIFPVFGQSSGMSCPGGPGSPRTPASPGPRQYPTTPYPGHFSYDEESEESEDDGCAMGSSPNTSSTYVRYDDLSYGNLNLSPPPQRQVAAVPPRCVGGPPPQPATVTMGCPRGAPLPAFQGPLRQRPVGVCRPMQRGTGRQVGVARPMVRQAPPVAAVGPMQRGGPIPGQGVVADRPRVPIRPFGQVDHNRIAVVNPRVATPPQQRRNPNQTYTISSDEEENTQNWSYTLPSSPRTLIPAQGAVADRSPVPIRPFGSCQVDPNRQAVVNPRMATSSPGRGPLNQTYTISSGGEESMQDWSHSFGSSNLSSIPSSPGSPRADPCCGIRPCMCNMNGPPQSNLNATYTANPNATYNVDPNATYNVNRNATYNVNPNATYAVSGYESTFLEPMDITANETGYDEFDPLFHSSFQDLSQTGTCG